MQHQFALDVLAARHVLDADDVDQLLELIDDLQDHRLGAAGDQRQARDRRIVGGGDRQRLDVVATTGKHAGHARERAGLVLEQNADDVSHGCAE